MAQSDDKTSGFLQPARTRNSANALEGLRTFALSIGGSSNLELKT
jgi:hypothetical protein